VAIFSAFAGVGAFVQYFTHYPAVCISLTLSFTMLYASRNEDLISLDPLTRLNNRNSLIRYFANNIKGKIRNYDSYLLFFDLNDFKQINDNYGHVSGDNALKIVSKALKRSCANHDFFACRYGGDEFILICNNIEPEEIGDIKLRLHDEIKSLCQEKHVNYRISLSSGCVKIPKKPGKLGELIEAADKLMYIDKSDRANNREEGKNA